MFYTEPTTLIVVYKDELLVNQIKKLVETKDDENVEYYQAAFGISGIETSFGFAITYLYKAGVLTLNEIADRMSAAPARILKLDGGEIKEGGVADLMIADLDEKWTVEPEKFVSKGKNSPFGGYVLDGVVKYTIVDGEIKYQA